MGMCVFVHVYIWKIPFRQLQFGELSLIPNEGVTVFWFVLFSFVCGVVFRRLPFLLKYIVEVWLFFLLFVLLLLLCDRKLNHFLIFVRFAMAERCFICCLWPNTQYKSCFHLSTRLMILFLFSVSRRFFPAYSASLW